MHLIPRDHIVVVLLACFVAGIVLDFPIHWYMKWLRKKADLLEGSYGKTGLMSLSRIVGRFERIMYVFVLAIGYPQFIVVWLGMKTVGGLELWNGKEPDEDNKHNEDNKHKGRARYQVYLIGTLLSLAAAVASYYVFCLWIKKV